MPLRFEQMRARLRDFDFQNLFIDELGWDHHAQKLDVEVDEHIYTLSAIAEKRGLVAFHLASSDGSIPDHPARKAIDAKVTKSVREHLIVYTDAERTEQVWQWVRREPGKPAASREHRYRKNQSGTGLIQKLQGIAFSLEEEEQLTLTTVTDRTRQAFDLDRVTKRFYDQFKAEHATFLKFIQGIPEEGLQRWYASVMLNRLMFIYFIQKKGFLGNDPNYLHNKLHESKRSGKDRYYREYLCPLFFEGFAKKPEERSTSTNRLLGSVPYLNGGLFLQHQIEKLYGKTITIADAAFEKLFAFFEQYNWHLDERPLRDDNEINPDVLGYIFEKYINQKQMGAYYTKEDITDYIGKNTVIPFLLERARESCKVAFEPGSALWKLLQTDPDRYLYEAVRRGVVLEGGSILPESKLPDFVQKGMHDPKARMFERRYNLGTARLLDRDGNNLALPTETWREYIERRKRCLELREKLAKGEVHEIADLITFNLNIRQFAQDIIENCEGPELLRALWRAIIEVSILDPTCGSGAFLFAALNILEPLYEACLDRMEGFLGDLERSGEKHRPKEFPDFRTVLEQIEKHPNERYFVLKTIMVNNLYGVDIMEEAIEICKLRLFLKLVAQVDDPAKIEPLPDIDFNIRAGNTLVGYARLEDLRKALAGKLAGFAEEEIQRIEEKAEDVEALFHQFRQQQTTHGGQVTPGHKDVLKGRLKELDDELNRYLAAEYGVEAKKKGAYEAWLESHKPFHWFVEFFGIMKRGGFDVIIGNPPYVEYAQVVKQYALPRIKTEGCGNLYAYVVERSFELTCSNGTIGLIVPISLVAAQRMSPLQDLVIANSRYLVLASFGLRPAALFPGVMQRLTILLCTKGKKQEVFTSEYLTWYAEERDSLFSLLSLSRLGKLRQSYSIPKTDNDIAHSALTTILNKPRPWTHYNQFKGRHCIYYHNAGGYWVKTFNFVPFYKSLKDPLKRHTTISELQFPTATLADTYLGVLNSSLFYFFWKTLTDARHVYPSDIAMLPIALPLKAEDMEELRCLVAQLMVALQKSKTRIVYGDAQVDQFNVAPTKAIIDQIDQLLAKHYGFTDEELDFIINYDIKYRMGRNSGGDGESEQ
jgi:hypothetical protein